MRRNDSNLRLFSQRFALGASLALVATTYGFAAETSAPLSGLTSVESVMQTITVQGKVVDSNGEPIIGANILVQGTTNGIITDLDGNFTLSNVNPSSKIVISYIGYKSQTVAAAATMNITLKEESEKLQEVVVVGYGVQKKVNLTGAVASVDFEEQTKSRPITTVANALAGLTPGLQASAGGAMPGSEGTTLRVRGTGTTNSAGPLVIIDGMEGSLGSLNPQDVENISVLKDAASCAIYGARAANGVILVTTKKGDRERVTINYSGRVSFNKPTRMIENINNYADYMELMNESRANIGQGVLFDQSHIDKWREAEKNPNGVNEIGVPNYIAYPNTNWIEELYNGGMMHEHNLSLNGGSDKVRFMLSARYQDNQGVVDNTASKTYSIRANVEATPTKWLTVGTRTYASQVDREVGNFDGAQNFLRQSTPGSYPEWNGVFGYPECPDESATANNPLQKLNMKDGFKRNNRFNTTLYSKVKFFKDLSWDFNFNYNRNIYESRTWDTGSYLKRFGDDVIPSGIPSPATFSTGFDYQSSYSYTLENLLNYHHTFAEKHDLSVLMGYQEYYNNYYKVNASKRGLIDVSLNQFDEATDMTGIGGETQDYATRSMFGRLNYAFNSRYLFEANFRYDGSSRFHEDNRWGFFPSVSAAWRISEESFMEQSRSWLDNLKIRGSWGKLGNSAIGNYEYLSVYSTTKAVFGNALNPGLFIGAYANNAIKWESTATANFGVDANMFRNRLSVGIDAYYKKTDGILYSPDIPGVFGGMGKPRQNLAEISNKGVELNASWQDNIAGVHYSISANFSYNKNNVDKYKGDYVNEWVEDPENKLTGGSYKNNIGLVSTGGDRRLLENHMLNEYYLRKVYRGNGTYFGADGKVNPKGGPRDGMIRTEKDMEWAKAMIAAGYRFKPGNSIAKNKIWYGDYVYADLNNNGVYGDDSDKEFLGKSNQPKYVFGFQISAAYKGFDISTVWSGAAGYDIYWGPASGANSSTTQRGVALPKRVVEDRYYYDPANPSDPRTNIAAKYPRLTYADATAQNTYGSDLWLQNGNYLKLKNLSVGYTLPKAWVAKVAMQNARVYISAENLLTITKFDGQDPESQTGVGYAPFRTIAIGANISF